MPVLHSLKCATTALCGESNVSLSMIYPVVANLLSKHLKEVPEESNNVTNFKENCGDLIKSAACTCEYQQRTKSRLHCLILRSQAQTPEVHN